MKSSKHILIIFLFTLHLQVQSQVLIPDFLESELEYYNRNGYLEKLFLDTDKDHYFTGEMMRFSIIALEGKYNKPNALSKIAYIELLDPENQPVLRGKFRLNDSHGAGILNLPDNLSSGNYILRAYTNWMRNYSPNYYFHQVVTIINPKYPPKIEYTGKNMTQVTFRPESGSLINGIENKVAVRVTNKYNNPFIPGCAFVVEGGDTLESILLDSQGIGLFSFIPESNKRYGICIEDSLYTLPASIENGANLSVEENIDNIRIRIYCTAELTKKDEVVLLLHKHGEVIDIQSIKLNENLGEYTIKRNKLPAGIIEFVLLNHELNYLTSRCLNGSAYKKAEISLEADLDNKKKRETVSMKINTSPGALLSVSVYLPLKEELSEDLVNESINYSAEAGPWMNIQTKKSASIYINESSGSYNKIIQNAPMKFPPEIRTDLISGSLMNDQHKNPPEFRLFMVTVGEESDIETLKVDSYGDFNVSAPKMNEPTQVLFISDSLEKLNIVINNEYSTEFASISTGDFSDQLKNSANLQKLLIASQINKLYCKKPFPQSRKTSTNFYGNPDEIILFSDYIELPIMEEFFRELVRYSIFTREKGSLKLNVLSKYTNRILGPDPLFLVDGIPVFNTQKILELDPETIKSIKVKANRYFYGNTVMDGIIDIESVEGNGSILNSYETVVNYFYEPPAEINQNFILYSNNPETSPVIPDQRTVLCWEPVLKADSQGNSELKFNASDIVGTYIIKITAITPDGMVGQLQEFIRIE